MRAFVTSVFLVAMLAFAFHEGRSWDKPKPAPPSPSPEVVAMLEEIKNAKQGDFLELNTNNVSIIYGTYKDTILAQTFYNDDLHQKYGVGDINMWEIEELIRWKARVIHRGDPQWTADAERFLSPKK